MTQDEPELLLPVAGSEATAEPARNGGGLHGARVFHGILGAVLAGLMAWGVVSVAGCEETVFCGGAARVAGFLSGNPVVPSGEGWRISAPLPVVVTTACSGTTYFIMVAMLAGWHLCRRGRSALPFACGATLAAVPAVLFVNGLRIVAVAQLHRWVLPQLPAAWGAFLHMLTGAAVFLPAFILLNLILEKHGNSHPQPEDDGQRRAESNA